MSEHDECLLNVSSPSLICLFVLLYNHLTCDYFYPKVSKEHPEIMAQLEVGLVPFLQMLVWFQALTFCYISCRLFNDCTYSYRSVRLLADNDNSMEYIDSAIEMLGYLTYYQDMISAVSTTCLPLVFVPWDVYH